MNNKVRERETEPRRIRPVCIHDIGSAVHCALVHKASVTQADVIKCKNSKNTAALNSLSNTRDLCLSFRALLLLCPSVLEAEVPVRTKNHSSTVQ